MSPMVLCISRPFGRWHCQFAIMLAILEASQSGLYCESSYKSLCTSGILQVLTCSVQHFLR